ncbi:MAG: flagellar hook-basal body complex protein, partial [Planctomycetes bacterium]|nr:flagellar hook-basal body complex protein [Planctomycetota bacterium]
GYKASSTTFSELLSQTIKKASAPAGDLGGVNPQQMGSGVGLASINRDMAQGNFTGTGRPLDAAISGEGFFLLRNAQQQNVYTRMGSFTVDSGNNLVDAATGYKVQRTGTYGAAFQGTGSDITIPYGAPMAASATASVTINGNVRSAVPSTVTDAATTNVVTSVLTLTNGGAVPAGGDFLSALDQYTGTAGAVNNDAEIDITYTPRAGTEVTDTIVVGDPEAYDIDTLLADISALFTGSTATLGTSGEIIITDDASGYSETAISAMVYTGTTDVGADDAIDMDLGFTLTTAGGNDTHTFTRDVYDAMGEKHMLTGTLVKTDTANTWDLVIPQIVGETAASSLYSNRVIEGIQFDPDGGEYNGLADTSTPLTWTVTFANNPTVTQDITFDLGTIGTFDGITQFASTNSNAAVSLQDGYAAGILSEVSIDNSGMILGKFTNDKTMTVAAVAMAIFQNPAAMEAVGGGYYVASSNSGIASETVAGANGAGSLEAGQLEQSNTDTAKEFVNMMQAQNGFQTNARTIRVANDILRELTNLIR